MKQRSFLAGLLVLVVSLFLLLYAIPSTAQALEKVKFATSVKMSPDAYLVTPVAQEQGFWKENGLKAEWIPMRGSGTLYRAVAAGEVKIGSTPGISFVQAAGRGIPVMVVSSLETKKSFHVWVLKNSPLKKADDLKGKKIRVGIPRIGGSSYAYGLAFSKILGFDVKFLAVGGLAEAVASLRREVVDFITQPIHVLIKLEEKGQVRDLLRIGDYLPKPWAQSIVFSEQKFANSKPDTVKRVIKTVLRTSRFIKDNPAWVKKRIMEMHKISEASAQKIYDDFAFSTDGKIATQAIGNIRRFALKYKLVKGGKLPPLSKLFTNKFTR